MAESLQAGHFWTWDGENTHLRSLVEVEVNGSGFQALGESESTGPTDARLLGHRGEAFFRRAFRGALRAELETFRPGADSFLAVRMSLENTGTETATLDRICPLVIERADDIEVAGVEFADWRVTRMARQKNDIPSVFRPTMRDSDYRDAAFGSFDVPAGQGIALGDGASPSDKESRERIVAEPCIMIRGHDGAPGLFIGVLGQSEHLSNIWLDTPPAGEFQGLRLDCEFDGVVLRPGERRTTHWILISEFEHEPEMLQRFADILADDIGVAKPPPEKPSMYCSWYFYGRRFGESDLEENLQALQDRPIPLDVFMIDGSWMEDFGSWEPNSIWPSGMKAAADKIRQSGFEPGIWTCPFVVMAHSPILQKYPDLIARDHRGEPCLFGYQGPKCYAVDVTAPSAKPYFEELFARLRGWGYRHHKFDFLRAIVAPEDIRFHDDSMNRAEAYRHGLKLIREAAGEDAYILACGGIFEGSAGLVDAVRTGTDTVGDWQRMGYAEDRPMCEVTAKQNLLRSYTARLWHVDPDALMLRLREEPYDPDHAHLSRGTLSDEEAFTMLTVQYLSGGIACIGERFQELSDDRRALLRHLMPQVADPATALDWQRPGCPSIFLSRLNFPESGLEPWHTLTMINWDDSPRERSVQLDAMPPEGRGPWAVFEFRTQQCRGVLHRTDHLTAQLPPHGTRVFRLAEWNGDNPVVLGTDAHVSGGASELRGVNISAGEISGRIQSPWQEFPVTVTAGFPLADAVHLESVTARPGKSFRIRLPQD